MRPWNKTSCATALLAAACLLPHVRGLGQPAADQDAVPASNLASEQKVVADRFGQLEALLLRRADLEAAENPSRAALLKQAVQLSKQADLSSLLADAASRLEQGQYSEAIEKQKTGRENLKRLLELLQSENREERIREQRDEVRRWIEETDRLLRLQSSLRGRTEGGQDTQQAAGDQDKLADKAAEISQQLGGDLTSDSQGSQESENDSSQEPASPSESGRPAEGESQPKELSQADGDNNGKPEGDASQSEESGKAGENEPTEDSKSPNANEPAENQPSDNKAGDNKSGENKSGEGQPSEGQPSEGQPSEGQPGQSAEGQPGQSQPSQAAEGGVENPPPPQSPTERAKQRIEQAQQKMKEAQQQLENAEREGAVEKQREAEERLREAIEELEEILRQLREEEIERSLATLETRLRRMLEMQTQVLDETTRLQEISGEETTRQVQIMASKLSLDERKILAEGERAYLLLREEGSSAAFPEAIEQLNTDVGNVAERLANGDVGKLTVVIETEIVNSLEEMVAALVQIQKENREKQQQQQQGQPQQGQPGDQPLVDKLAELRLIRTLQIRINNRTGALSQMLDNPEDAVGQAQAEDILTQLRGLSERQSSIGRVTRDIVVGKGE